MEIEPTQLKTNNLAIKISSSINRTRKKIRQKLKTRHKIFQILIDPAISEKILRTVDNTDLLLLYKITQFVTLSIAILPESLGYSLFARIK